jgi:nucleotidyltransferase/DNA polymerase involved in DNA repair
MVNARREQFSLTVEKTAKNRRYSSNHSLAHTLPKGKRTKRLLKRGQSGNEKGVNRNLLFVGFDVYVAARIGANTISQVRQFKTLRATVSG